MLYKNLLAVAAAVAPALAQSDTPDLTTLVGSDDRLSTLGTILESFPDVASALANATNVTVLAPTNEAFNSFLETLDLSLEDVSSDMVAAILNYHVLSGMVMSTNITENPTFVNTLLTNETYTNVTDGQVVSARVEDDEVIITSGLKTDATVVEAVCELCGILSIVTDADSQQDLNFTGGIAHIIDQVNIIPPNVTDLASAANLTYFLGALEAANLTDTLVGLLDVTILAPSNSAFESIGSALGNLSTEALTSILQNHVINGTIAYSPSIGNGTVETLGGEVNLTVADSAIFINQARVVNADNLVANGVVHIIDSVLNPNGTGVADPESDDAQEDFEGASSVAVVELTSGVPPATTTVENLVTTTLQVASGYTTVTEGPVGSGAGGAGAEETSEEAAAMVTGAVGMAALFGGAALAVNL